ncbi:MAG: hypothetical protein II453_20215 [Alphaproteobacteria bacterium]|nr:hypothetical protein [Alphaproteobacteria bacterium]
MEKVNQILINIQSSIQYIVDAVIGLLFQPLYAIVAIIQALIEIWSATPEEETEQEPQQAVTTYPSANEGKYPEEVDYPIGRQRIGFHINQNEADELNKIREELNK